MKSNPTYTFHALLTLGVLGTLTLAGCASATEPEPSADGDGACGNFTVAIADDDVRRMAFYGIENDLVDTSAFENIEVTYLQFPGLIQATGTDQFDVVESSIIGIPLARDKGVDLKIVALSSGRTGDEDTEGVAGIYVRADSDIDEPEDLVGRTIGVSSFGSTGTLTDRILLSESHDINADIQGGDITWVELDPAQLIASLDRGQIDAVPAISYPAWVLGNDDNYRLVQNDDVAWRELTGADPIGAAYQALASQVDANKECYLAFQDVLTESVEYARANVTELADAVSEVSGLPAAYNEFQWGDAYDYAGNLDQKWLDAAQSLWDYSEKIGALPLTLNIEDEVVK